MRLLILAFLSSFPFLASAQSAAPATETKVPVIFTGGYETVGVDRGRPVVLIAAARHSLLQIS